MNAWDAVSLMARGPLARAVAGSTGGLAGLLFGFAKEVAFGDSGLSSACPLPSLPAFEPDTWHLDFPSVCVGLLIGLLLGPLLDLAFLVPVQLLRQAWRRLGAVGGWYMRLRAEVSDFESPCDRP